MKRYAYNLLSAALLVAACLIYLQEDDGGILALTCAVAAFMTLAGTLICKWYRAKAQK